MPSISGFFDEVLDAPFKNARWSWGAISRDQTQVFLRVWQNEFIDVNGTPHVAVLRDVPRSESSAGYRERAAHLALALPKGLSANNLRKRRLSAMYRTWIESKSPSHGNIEHSASFSTSVDGEYGLRWRPASWGAGGSR